MFKLSFRSPDCIQTEPDTFGRGVPQFWWNFLRWVLVFTWKNWDLALWNFFWSLGCVKNAKNVKIVKTRFLRELRLYLQNGKVNYYDFLAQNTFDHKQKNGKKNFQNFYPFLRKHQLCKSWNFSKTCFFTLLKFKT